MSGTSNTRMLPVKIQVEEEMGTGGRVNCSGVRTAVFDKCAEVTGMIMTCCLKNTMAAMQFTQWRCHGRCETTGTAVELDRNLVHGLSEATVMRHINTFRRAGLILRTRAVATSAQNAP